MNLSLRMASLAGVMVTGLALAQTGPATTPSTAPAATTVPTTLTSQERVYGLAKVWMEVRRCYPMWHRLPDLDWDAEFQQRIPLVAADQEDLAYYRQLEAFMALIQDSHVSIILPAPMRNAQRSPAIKLQYVDGKYIVIAFAKSLAVDSPLTLGDELVVIDGQDVHRFVEQSIKPYLAAPNPRAAANSSTWRLLAGPAGSEVAVRLRKPDGREYEAHWAHEPVGEDTWIRYEPWSSLSLVSMRRLGDGIGYIQISSFNREEVVEQFDQSLSHLGKINGLIIDVRNNGGGKSGYGDRILRRLTSAPLPGMIEKRMHFSATLWSWRQGEAGKGIQWENVTQPAIQPADDDPRFDGRLIVLTSVATASAAEDFVGPLKAAHRATLIGEATCGSTGNPLMFDLPGGGGFRVCTRYMLQPDGTEFIGPGIQSDIEVVTHQADVAAGRDPVFERAIEELSH